MRIKQCSQTWIPGIALTILFIATIACGTSSNVPAPTFDPNLLQTAVAGTYAVSQIQTLTAGVPINAQVPNMPEPTNTAAPTDMPLPQPTATFAPESLCTKMRFAEYLGPDDVDEMINEGVSFADVSEIAVRFDCSATSSNQITWEWRVNGDLHCTKYIPI